MTDPDGTDDLWHILVIVDGEAVHGINRPIWQDQRVLGRRLALHEVRSTTEARSFLENAPARLAVILVDVTRETEPAGLALIRWIRQQPHLHPTRIVVRTGEGGALSPEPFLRGYEISDVWPKTGMLASRMQTQLAGLVRTYDQLRTLDAARNEQAQQAHTATRALATLTKQHQNLRSVTNAIDAGLLVLQGERIVLCNDGALRLLGVDEAPSFSALPLPLRPGTPDRAAVFTHIQPGGRQLSLRAKTRSVPLEGSPALLVTLVDHTEVREAEARRIQAETELLRTQHTEHIGLLAGGIAHDLNNLLSVVTSNGEFLREELDGAPLLEAIDDSLGAARAAAALVQQLLAYSGSGSVFRRPLDLVATVAESTRLWRTQARQNGILLSLDETGVSATVVSDAALIGQIVGNLLSNAIRHTPKGGHIAVAVTHADVAASEVETWRQPSALQAGRYALLSIKDEGPGIPAADQARIFEPFFTTSATGRGLGLAAVQGIVNRLGGGIRVRPNAPRGTCFEVILPAPDADEAALWTSEDSLQGVAPAPEGIEPTQASRQRKVLVLDDLPLVRKQLGRIAKRAGLSATLCATIAEAVAAVEATRFDVAIIDYQLDGETGDDALVQIRAVQPHLPAVLCTGYAGSQDFADLDVPFDAVVHKPFRPKELTALLFSLL